MDVTAVTALVTGGVGGAIAVAQFRLARKARQVEAYLAVLRSVQEDRVRDARQQLLQLGETKPYAEWSREDKDTAGRALNPYASIAEMVGMRLLPVPVVRIWADSITACRHAADDYLRERRETQPLLWHDLDLLCQRLEHPSWHEKLIWRWRYPKRRFPEVGPVAQR
jgi:hypothetical protein